jgi:uncharacterized protein
LPSAPPTICIGALILTRIILSLIAKAAAKRTTTDLDRLDRMRGLLVAEGADCARAKLLLFGRSGFSKGLRAAAKERTDVGLVDLNRIYHGD